MTRVTNPSAANTTIKRGNYTGDGSANRAIAHALGAIPKLVIIRNTAAVTIWIHGQIIGGLGQVLFSTNAGYGSHVVTAPTTTVFYVGNAASYPQSCNENLVAYQWVAWT